MAAQRPTRWGCVGTGNIALAMAQQLSRLPGARKELICSGSGKPAAAVEDKRAEYGYARACTLDELVVDPDVDVVYVASANSAHARHCLAALRGGKPVLCEKPLTLSAEEAEEVFAEAERRELLLVDGTFSACLPAFDVVRARLPDIGPVQHVELHKKIRMTIMENSSIINSRSLGGGLFDGCGSYTMHALCVIFGAAALADLRPGDVKVESVPGHNGEVDWDTTVTLRLCGATVLLTHRAMDDARTSIVRGERGVIEFTLPRLESVTVNGERFDTSYGGPPFAALAPGEPGAPGGLHLGLGVEAAAVQRALAAGVRGPGMAELPLSEMRAVAHAMDLVRHRIPTHLHFKPEPGL